VLHSESEVSDFDLAVFEEDVGWLEIAVDDAAGVDVIVACEDLVHEYDGFSFRDTFPIGDEFGEISSLAQLSDYVGIVFGAVDVIDFYYVLAILQTF